MYNDSSKWLHCQMTVCSSWFDPMMPSETAAWLDGVWLADKLNSKPIQFRSVHFKMLLRNKAIWFALKTDLR